MLLIYMKQILKFITQKQVDQMILFKYHQNVDNPDEPAYVSNATIGKVYGIDGSSVSRLLKQRFEQLSNCKILTRQQRLEEQRLPQRQKYGMRFLKPEHIDFLKSPDTLLKWASKSLKERCLLFHRQFGDHRINPTLLTQFYAKHKIKRKRVKTVKEIDPAKEAEYEKWRQDIKQKIADLKQEHYRIIYLDESLFTTKTI